MWWVLSRVVAEAMWWVGGWLDQVGIKLSQLSTKLMLKLKLSLAISFSLRTFKQQKGLAKCVIPSHDIVLILFESWSL